MNIKTMSFGCRLNSLECDKIAAMLAPHTDCAIIVNTCAVTNEAERQMGQAVRSKARENPNVPIFVTGCAATRNPAMFAPIPNAIVVDNFHKLDLDSYICNVKENNSTHNGINQISDIRNQISSKQFIQIQNGCNHECSFCITRILRGRAVSFPYEAILTDVRNAVANGFFEVVLTGIDIASYCTKSKEQRAKSNVDKPFLISDLCKKLLADVPEIRRFRLSSMDPASPEIPKLLAMMRDDPRMMPHIHLSMQSGSDAILGSMRRRHTADMVRKFVLANPDVSFSWDMICGFPGETDELFNDTVSLIRELKPIKIHAFPFSPRPGTTATDLPNHVNPAVSKRRVKLINSIADDNCREFMRARIGTVTNVLMEENNIARTPDDIPVKIEGPATPARTICDVKLIDISDLHFIGKIC